MESIHDLAQKWLDKDRDPDTRGEIEDLLNAGDDHELELRLRHRISFGTAGLRSSMKAGFSQMNSLTVMQASQGLAQYVIDQGLPRLPASEQQSIVIGYDARHNSERFARLAAAAFLAKGLKVLWFGQLVHTPLVSFAVKYHSAAAGVMITASHNPKTDNGYKVYWQNSCQIIPPHDTGIAMAIAAVSEITTWDDGVVDRDGAVENIFDETVNAYSNTLRPLVLPLLSLHTPVKFAYTPMHGVGLPFMETVAAMFGDRISMRPVNVQSSPDPEFPTVPFPNPEEKGALSPAIIDAEQSGCTLIIANDPDADRFATVERLQSGSWHQFTGNQMGVLLASYLHETYQGDRSKLAMLASTVSSRMLAAMAQKEGFLFRETLTGFKWLGNIAQQLTKEGYDAVYAYEEAIGYMFSQVVWDKDGIAAAAVFLKACILWSGQGLTPWEKLQKLYREYGYFDDANTYLISPSPTVTNKVFTDIRVLNAGSRPQIIGRRKIIRWRDLTLGFDSGSTDNEPDLPVDPTAQMLTCELEDVVFTARGSGTEPKIKLYIEAHANSTEIARNKANEVLQDLLREWFRPHYGLKLAGP